MNYSEFLEKKPTCIGTATFKENWQKKAVSKTGTWRCEFVYKNYNNCYLYVYYNEKGNKGRFALSIEAAFRRYENGYFQMAA